jgi:AcrR family transcriptional regulator
MSARPAASGARPPLAPPPGPDIARCESETRLLDAAERMLIHSGYVGITVRRLADEAGVNHGLVHYYFGSMEELLLQVLERFTGRLIARQRAMYATPVPFVERWRAAMRYLDDDRPYQKIWWELQAMAWNRAEFRARLAGVHAAWREAMRESVREALARYRLDETSELSLDAWITLIVTMNEGIITERLAGIEQGHEELLAAVDRWLTRLEAAEAEPAAEAGPAAPRARRTR